MNDEIEKLVSMVAGSGVREVTVTADGLRVTVRKSRRTGARPAEMVVAVDEAALTAAAEAAGPEVRWITSTMVGIFRSVEPRIEVGQAVGRAQKLGAIESMKIMTDVLTDEAGTVAEVIAEEGMPVEYGQRLYALAE